MAHDLTFVRCIEPRVIRPDYFAGIDSLRKAGAVVPNDGDQLFMVLGIARNVIIENGRQALSGEFEAMILGQAGRVQSRTCALLECEASIMLKTHVMRWPAGYELSLVCMAHAFPDADVFTRYIVHHMHIIADPNRG